MERLGCRLEYRESVLHEHGAILDAGEEIDLMHTLTLVKHLTLFHIVVFSTFSLCLVTSPIDGSRTVSHPDPR